MNDIIVPDYSLISMIILPILSAALLYFVIKIAVRNGVREANRGMNESVHQIEKTLIELNMRITKKESD